MAIAILFAALALLLFIGVPVGFALIAAALATVLYLDLPAIVVVQQTAAGASTASLIASSALRRMGCGDTEGAGRPRRSGAGCASWGPVP